MQRGLSYLMWSQQEGQRRGSRDFEPLEPGAPSAVPPPPRREPRQRDQLQRCRTLGCAGRVGRDQGVAPIFPAFSWPHPRTTFPSHACSSLETVRLGSGQCSRDRRDASLCPPHSPNTLLDLLGFFSLMVVSGVTCLGPQWRKTKEPRCGEPTGEPHTRSTDRYLTLGKHTHKKLCKVPEVYGWVITAVSATLRKTLLFSMVWPYQNPGSLAWTQGIGNPEVETSRSEGRT